MAYAVIYQDPISGITAFTALEGDTLPNCAAGSIAYITDVPGRIDMYVGGAWVQTHANGNLLVASGVLEYQPYEDATYNYYCEAAPGTAVATAAWRVSRVNKTTGKEEWAANGTFTLAATDLATVQGHF